MLYSPEAGLALQELGAAIRYSSVPPDRARELAILTVASELRCEFEWYAHHGLARASGVPAPVIDALRQGHMPGCAAKPTGPSSRWCARLWPMAGSATKHTAPPWPSSGRAALWSGAADRVLLCAREGHGRIRGGPARRRDSRLRPHFPHG